MAAHLERFKYTYWVKKPLCLNQEWLSDSHFYSYNNVWQCPCQHHRSFPPPPRPPSSQLLRNPWAARPTVSYIPGRRVFKQFSMHVIFVARLTIHHVICLWPLTSSRVVSLLHCISPYIQLAVPPDTWHHHGLYPPWWQSYQYIPGASGLLLWKNQIVNIFWLCKIDGPKLLEQHVNWIEKFIYATHKDFSVYFQ